MLIQQEENAVTSDSCNFGKQSSKKRFRLNEAVEGNYIGGIKWFPAKVRRVNKDGTYDLDYEVSILLCNIC